MRFAASRCTIDQMVHGQAACRLYVRVMGFWCFAGPVVEQRHHILLATASGERMCSCLVSTLLSYDRRSLCTGNLNTASLHTLGTTQLGALGMCAKTCKRRMPGCIASMPNHGTGSRGSHACSLPHPGL